MQGSVQMASGERRSHDKCSNEYCHGKRRAHDPPASIFQTPLKGTGALAPWQKCCQKVCMSDIGMCMPQGSTGQYLIVRAPAGEPVLQAGLERKRSACLAGSSSSSTEWLWHEPDIS